LSIGIAVRATIGQASEVHRWQVTSGGEGAITIWMIDLAGDHSVEVYAPEGWLAGTGSSADAGDLALQVPAATPGNYVVVVTAIQGIGSPYRLVATLETD
jgi:hypothetical protein